MGSEMCIRDSDETAPDGVSHGVQLLVRLLHAILVVVQHLAHDRAVRQGEELGVLRSGGGAEGTRQATRDASGDEDAARAGERTIGTRGTPRGAWWSCRVCRSRRVDGRTTFSVASHAAWPACSGFRPPMRVVLAAMVPRTDSRARAPSTGARRGGARRESLRRCQVQATKKNRAASDRRPKKPKSNSLTRRHGAVPGDDQKTNPGTRRFSGFTDGRLFSTR